MSLMSKENERKVGVDVFYRRSDEQSTVHAATLLPGKGKGKLELQEFHKLSTRTVLCLEAEYCLHQMPNILEALEANIITLLVQHASDKQPEVNIMVEGAASISAVIRLMEDVTRSHTYFGNCAMDPKVFYGLEKDVPKVMTTFFRQIDAFEYVDNLRNQDHDTSQVKVYSFENMIDGGRRFLAADLPEFADQYMSTVPAHRHAYEIIREGEPCRAYFDLEFSQKMNPSLDGHLLTERLVS